DRARGFARGLGPSLRAPSRGALVCRQRCRGRPPASRLEDRGRLRVTHGEISEERTGREEAGQVPRDALPAFGGYAQAEKRSGFVDIPGDVRWLGGWLRSHAHAR